MGTALNSHLRHCAAPAAAVLIAGASALAAPGTALAAPPMPSGYYRGDVTSAPIADTVWFGKNFTGSRVVNNTAIGWAFPGAVYPGRSVQDGAPVIVVDYSGTLVGFVRDELRADGRGGYRGRALSGTTELLRFHLTR
ncbi:hypothetical protein ACLTEW_19085 [Gordonia lacunae]|uniref:Peptidase M23 n=1 Tax=Gordonia lacunae TaxID=417102 RepID=A0A243QCD3_9ACTN|nr:hypothetical protein [Gordonia lacunae]OUC79349.1 hypothetical protein CA982_07740 [Gordonia lacunae]